VAFVIAITALAAVACLLAVLARIEESLLADPEIRAASRPAPLTPRAAAVKVAARAEGHEPGDRAGPVQAPVVAA
jgi:hypothetical protein